MKLTPEMVAELGLDVDKIINYCETKAAAAALTLDAIYAERRTTGNYRARYKEEETARRDRQKFCQWRNAWSTMRTTKTE